MCGIAGIVQEGPAAAELRETAERMAALLAHRGPDGAGVLVRGPAALAHRRLMVIDPATGAQPMSDPTGRFHVVFNGEIYNYRELREQLRGEGLSFATASDTEVLLQAYARHGQDCLALLDGMFAFALWDSREQSLFAARDRLGKKPFYYRCDHGRLVFASELAALNPAGAMGLDHASLAAFLCCKCVPCPATIFAEAAKLPPGHCLTWQAGNLRVRPYWTLPEPGPAPDMEEAAERLRGLLRSAVRKRLKSDVPLGAFLSGGLDSTVVATLMAQEASEVRTFSIGFAEPSYDETRFALAAADFAGTRHSVRQLDAALCLDMLADTVAGFDEPLADPSIVPTRLLSRFAREHVTVALSGDGADELFGGYEHLPAFVWARRLALGGAAARAALRGLEALLPVSRGYVSPRHALRRFRQAVAAPDAQRVPRLLLAFEPEALAALCSGPLPSTADLLGRPEEGFGQGGEPLDRALRWYVLRYLPDYILAKVDRCSMRHGLEVRSPFLDTAVVEFAAGLPASFKMPGARRKWFMKQALGRHMPGIVRRRGKRGFLMPVAGWLAGSLRGLLRDMASPARLERQGLFRPEAVARLLREHEEGSVDRREELWTFLVLQIWLESRGL
jgi:asparagine synthase (glutamine-hydrolysing)